MPLTNPTPLSSDVPNERPVEIAAIDLGSNSFHMVVARIVNNSLQVLSRIKQRVHLAEGLDSKSVLSEDAMERGLACLSLFAERLQGVPSENVRIVGTHTLRQAVNADEFLKRAAAIIPYQIELISGSEEARLIFMGVAHTQPEKGRKLVVDIGGGSTELVVGDDFEPILTESRRMGCVSFGQLYFPNQEISAAHFTRARLAAAQKLETLVWKYRLQGWQCALGASGSIKAISEVIIANGDRDGLITPQRLDAVVRQVLNFRHFAELDLPGLSEDRRTVFAPGLAILCGVFDALAIQEMRLSDGALREGVLYEMDDQFRHEHTDIRTRTAKSLAEHYNLDREQAERVLTTTKDLYIQWAVQNRYLVQPQLENLLFWAALLHEIGLSINHAGMHRHGAYILQNTNMPGFTQEQQLLLAMMVRYHKKSLKIEELPRFTLFKKKYYLPMIQLLRLGALLNNQRQSTTPPSSLRLSTDDNHWTLTFPQGYLSTNALVQLDFEREQNYWEQVVGWKLILEESASE